MMCHDQLRAFRDRLGHDRRYAVNTAKLSALDWQPQITLERGLRETVSWYRDNAWWWETIRTGAYREYYERHYGRALKA